MGTVIRLGKERDGGEMGLVHRFVTEAMLAANVKLQPWVQKFCMYSSGAGEKHRGDVL